MAKFRRRPDEIEAIQWDRRQDTLQSIRNFGLHTTGYIEEEGMSISGMDGRGSVWKADPFDWVIYKEYGWIEVMNDWQFRRIWEPGPSCTPGYRT